MDVLQHREVELLAGLCALDLVLLDELLDGVLGQLDQLLVLLLELALDPLLVLLQLLLLDLVLLDVLPVVLPEVEVLLHVIGFYQNLELPCCQLHLICGPIVVVDEIIPDLLPIPPWAGGLVDVLLFLVQKQVPEEELTVVNLPPSEILAMEEVLS